MRICRKRSGPPPGHLVDSAVGPTTPAGAGRLVGVIGASGAPGRSFISVNTAVWLAQRGLSVCLIDADPGLGTVAAQLDLSEERSLFYLAHESTLSAVDDELIDRHLQHFGPLAVLTGRFEPGRGGAISDELMGQVTGLLRSRFRLVIADLGPLDNPATATMAIRCQLLLWVVSPTPLGADRFDRTVTSALASPLRPKPSLAIVNGTGTGSLLETEDALVRRYGVAVGASVPHHRLACLEAEASHRPAVLGGPLSEPLRRVAAALESAALRPGQLETARDLGGSARSTGSLLPDGAGS